VVVVVVMAVLVRCPVLICCINPTAPKNAVRTVMEGLRQESSDGVIRTTSISPGFVDTELDSSIDHVPLREQIRRTMSDFGLPPAAVARAIAFAIEQPHDVEIGDIVVRATVQG